MSAVGETRSRERLSASALDDVALRAAEIGLIGLILLAPLPFGSVQPAAVFGVVAWSAALGAIVFLRPGAAPAPYASARPIVLAGLLLLLGAAQMLPLPERLIGLLSPALSSLRATIPGDGGGGAGPLSVHPGATGEQLAKFTAYAVVFFVAAAVASRRRGARRIFGAIFAVGVFQAVYGSIEYLSGHQHIFTYQKRFYTDTATGTYINQNHFAGALEMALLVGLGFLLARLRRTDAARRPPSWRQRIVSLFDGEGGRTMTSAALLALVALGLVVSYSRSGIAFGVLASLAVVAIDLTVHGDRRRAIPVFVVGAGVLVLVTLVGWERVGSDLERQMGGIGLEGGRVRVWIDSLGIVRDFPLFGTGLGTFREIYPLYRDASVRLVYDHAHNDYLEMIVETGIAGAALLAAMFVLYGRAVARGLARYRRSDLPLMLGGAGGVAALLLHEATDFNMQIPANAILFAALSGALLGGLRSPAEAGATSVVAFGPVLARRTRSA